MARIKDRDAIYEVADLFRQRCLIEQRSLLWPDQEIWKIKTIDQACEWISVNRASEKEPPFLEVVSELATEEPTVFCAVADAWLFFLLFPSSFPHTVKLSALESILQSDPYEADIPTLDKIRQALSLSIGGPGGFINNVRYQIAPFLRICRQIMSDQVNPRDLKEVSDSLLLTMQGIKQESPDRRPRLMGEIFRYLLFPDDLEPIISKDAKAKIQNKLGKRYGITKSNNVDEDIKRIRVELEREFGQDVSFYDGAVEELWKKETRNQTERDTVDSYESTQSEDDEAVIFDHLVEETFLKTAFVEEIYELLLDKRQVIFEGPPGSGKTFVAEKFARWFAGDSLDDATAAPHVETVQFHQSYGYEDFVQGIRPETTPAGGLSYAVKDGIFKRLCDRAAKDPDQPYVLLIDEINRGNISRIFGELLYLLEYRNRSVSLPYAADDQKLTIPENLYIIGTMNSADRSLAQVDYALRRRFYFVRFMPVVDGRAPVLEQWLQKQPGLDQPRRERILSQFIDLNTQVEHHLTADVQVGHSYFMQKWIADPGSEQRIWRHAVRPLLEEYFHHHKDREATLSAMTPNFNITLELPDPALLEDIVPESLDAE